MSRTFICSVGTSLIDNAKENGISSTGLEGLATDAIDSSPAKGVLNEIKKLIKKADTPDKRRKLAAELKGLLLYRPEIIASDEIFLLHDDSLVGRVCAEGLKLALAAFLNYPENSPNIIVQKVDGLQVHRFEDFNRKGIRKLYNVVVGIINERGGEHNPNIILNITGGYKAVVPYLTLLGMLYKKEIIYIFRDDQSELIHLPALPLTYDEDLFWRAAPFLKRLFAETFVPARQFPKELEEYRNSYIPAIIEEDQGNLNLSSFGELLYARFLQDYPSDLAVCNIPFENKKISLREDHGKDELTAVAKRLVKSHYVCEVVNSLPFNSGETKRIRPNQTFENGLVEIILPKTDQKLGMVLRTSGRSPAETARIAQLLEQKFNW